LDVQNPYVSLTNSLVFPRTHVVAVTVRHCRCCPFGFCTGGGRGGVQRTRGTSSGTGGDVHGPAAIVPVHRADVDNRRGDALFPGQ